MSYHNSELTERIYSLHSKTKGQKEAEEYPPHILNQAEGLLANLGTVFREVVMDEFEISYPTFNRILGNKSIGKIQTTTTVQIMNALVKYINFEWKKIKLESLQKVDTDFSNIDP